MHGNGGGLIVIAHSMGNGVFRYFLEWLKLELGKNHWQKWIDKHISTYFAVGSPLLGSSEALELLVSGLTQGLPITQKEIRKLVVTFGAILSFLPIPSTLNSTHDNEPLISVRYEAISDNQDARETKYTAAEIANGQLFRDMAVKDPIFGHLEEVRKRFYEEDDVLDFFVPWERPPIASVYSVYGVNMPDTDIEGHWYQVALANEHDRLHSCSKTGDATVPYHSLSWAHTWLGEPGTFVNVTQVPQSVYFSAENIKQFQAVRHGESHHAEYSTQSHKQPMCVTKKDAVGAVADNAGFLEGLFKSSTTDQITFFERKTEVNGVTRSTGVWEVDNAGHREILANPAFLRELRAEIRQVFKGKIISDKVRPVDTFTNGNPQNVALTLTLFIPCIQTSRPPVIDSDCYWNYRQAKCEFPEFCEYRYSFGDVILDQSCRLRQQPIRQQPKRVRPPLVDKDELEADERSDESVVELAADPTTVGPYVEAARPYCSAPCSPSSSSHGLDAKVLGSDGGICT
ncbi:Phospholipid sterol acyl transferase 1, partial [Globisporangium splendens]